MNEGKHAGLVLGVLTRFFQPLQYFAGRTHTHTCPQTMMPGLVQGNGRVWELGEHGEHGVLASKYSPLRASPSRLELPFGFLAFQLLLFL